MCQLSQTWPLDTKPKGLMCQQKGDIFFEGFIQNRNELFYFQRFICASAPTSLFLNFRGSLDGLEVLLGNITKAGTGVSETVISFQFQPKGTHSSRIFHFYRDHVPIFCEGVNESELEVDKINPPVFSSDTHGVCVWGGLNAPRVVENSSYRLSYASHK